MTFQILRPLIWSIIFAGVMVRCNKIAVSQVIYQNDFEDDSVGVYAKANLNADWNTPSFDNGVEQGRVSIVDGAEAYDDGKSLAVSYPAGLFGSGDSKTGAQWKLDFDQGYEAVELEYRIKFRAGFDFVRGGKLPGLIGGEGNVGGNKPDGTDGFSARMMWRTNGSGGSNLTSDTNNTGGANQANIVQYVYHPDSPDPNGFGEDFDWDDGPSGDWKFFEPDRWYHLRHRVVMNTPGQHDGVVQAWLDGVQVLDRNDVRFRDIGSIEIDQMYFSTFFGGGSQIWATSKDEVAYFDDFVITALNLELPGDFDNDGDVDVDDVDLFAGNIGGPATGALTQLDLDNDGTITLDDYNAHVTTLVQASNGIAGTLLGDVNLDGTVDVLNDAFTLVGSLGQAATSRFQGDLNADGNVDVLSDAFILVGTLNQSNTSTAASE